LNANVRINILSITADCREYRLFVAHNLYESVTILPKPLVGWGGLEFGKFILRKIILSLIFGEVLKLLFWTSSTLVTTIGNGWP